jgi:hypothetical protein
MSQDNSRVSSSSNLRVLLADTNWWANSARLAIGLAEAGCQVSAICPKPNHALTKTRAVQQTFRYHALRPIESLNSAIKAVDPDIVIPACDRSVRHLHELHRHAKSQGNAGLRTMALIERSLGLPSSHPIVSSRYDLLALARDEGVRVSNMSQMRNQEDFDSWKSREPYPWVLKADGTWGGGGVRIIRSAEEAELSLMQLEKMSRFTRSIKRLVVNRDPFWLREWWTHAERSIIAQAYIQGRPANCSVVCWEGKILAGIAVEVVRSEGATGPACVVCVVDNSEMMKAAEKIAARLGLSGFFGLDFMIEDVSDHVYLIEMNPRLAPPSHLRLGKGRDLAGALWAQLAGRPSPEFPSVTESNLIAYFPQGLKDDGDFAEACYRDIPQGEPALVSEMLNPFPDRTFLFRMVEFLTRGGIPDQGAVMQTFAANHKLTNSRKDIEKGIDGRVITEPVGKAGARST